MTDLAAADSVPCPPSDPADLGARAAGERRRCLLATASPAVRARILGTPPPYASIGRAARITVDLASGKRRVERDVAAEPDLSQCRADRLRREIAGLERQRAALGAKVEALRDACAAVDAARGERALAAIAARFLTELERAGYRVEGRPCTMRALLGDRRTPATARPRMLLMWLCGVLEPGASLMVVARFFGRDHTTVVHARQSIGRVLAGDEALAAAAFATCEAFDVEPPDLLLRDEALEVPGSAAGPAAPAEGTARGAARGTGRAAG